MTFAERYRSAFERLGFPLALDDGTPESELLEVERRLKSRLPLALREYFRIAGREKTLNNAHNHFLAPAKLEVAGDKLVFMIENQGVVIWSIERSSNDDPPVFQGSPDRKKWFLEHPNLSTYLEVTLYWQAVMSSVFPCVGLADVPATAQKALDQNLLFIGDVSGLRAYTANGVALCFLPWDQTHRIFVAGPSEETVGEVLRLAGRNWDEEFDQV